MLAANYPVIIEAATIIDPQDANGPADDLWAAHYLLVTGYDDATGRVHGADPLRGPDKKIPYDTLMEDWKPFNYLYMVIYLPEDEAEVAAILGQDLGRGCKSADGAATGPGATAADPKLTTPSPGSIWGAPWSTLSATRRLRRPLISHLPSACLSE